MELLGNAVSMIDNHNLKQDRESNDTDNKSFDHDENDQTW